jgi:hypothetical protein
LVRELTELDRQIIRNLDITGNLANPLSIQPQAESSIGVREPRPEVRSEGWCFLVAENPIRCRVVDVSKKGFRIQLRESSACAHQGDKLLLVHEFKGQIIQCKAEIKWIQSNAKLGCLICQSSEDWNEMIAQMMIEVSGQSAPQSLPSRQVG